MANKCTKMFLGN